MQFQSLMPSLRLVLADILFRAIDIFTATAIAATIMALIAIPIAAAIVMFQIIKQFISICSL